MGEVNDRKGKGGRRRSRRKKKQRGPQILSNKAYSRSKNGRERSPKPEGKFRQQKTTMQKKVTAIKASLA